METRLKERLTGAAILVALIVLVVPELFHGQRRDVAVNASSGGEGPPIRSYTIDLSNGPARTAPLQSTDSAAAESATAASAPTAAPAQGATEGGSADGGGANSTSAAASNGNGSASAASSTPGGTAGKAPGAASSAPGRAAPAKSASASAKSANAAAGSSAWSVQLGLFASRENAERLMRSAQGKGFPVGVSEADGKGLYHVQATGLADRAAALALQGRMHDQGLQAALVAPQSGSAKSPR
jgi:cell division septation protein DedD